jgi:putative hydrolase of the HAD superfamily
VNKVNFWNNKQHIFLDLEGVLLDVDFAEQFWQEILPGAYASLQLLNIDQAKALVSSYANSVVESLDLYAVDYWNKKVGIDILALKQKNAHLIKLKQHAEKFLFYVNNINPKLVCHLVSNSHPDVLNFKTKLTGLDGFFTNITSSHTIGMLRHDVKFWQTHLAALNICPSKVLLIDSNTQTAKIANDLGIDVVVVQPEMDHMSSIDVSLNNPRINYIKNLAELLPDNLNNSAYA